MPTDTERERAHTQYLKHREKRLAEARAYRETHKAEHAAESRERYGRKPEYWQKWSLKRKFGLTEADWQRMFQEQDGLCAICRGRETRIRNGRIQRLCVDHDHTTNQIRGLLCHRCNTAIRSLDVSGLLTAAIAYLSR